VAMTILMIYVSCISGTRSREKRHLHQHRHSRHASRSGKSSI